MFELRAAAEIQPPNLIVLLHVVIYATKDPNTPIPDPAGMVIARHKSPGTRPGPCLEIEVANVVQHTVVTGLPAANVQFILENNSGMTSAAAWYRSVKFGLCPVCCFQIEHYNIGKMLAVLVLPAKNQKLTALPQTRRVA